MHQAQSVVLLVEDNSLDRKVLSRRLRQEGYAVEHATNGEEALRKIKTERFDLVLLDIIMPRLGGFQVLRETRKFYSLDALPIIMVTAGDDSEDMVLALTLGANDYLTKNMPPRVALARIATHLSLKQLALANREFLHIASHDLTRPLAELREALQTLDQRYPLGTIVTEQAHELLALSLSTVEHMQHILTAFQDLHVIESGHIRITPHIIDLHDLIRQVVQSNAYYAQQKEHSLHLELAPELPPVQADESRLRQVIDNLIGNAIKFSPYQATTVVRTRLESDSVVVEVKDTGPGLTEQDLEKVFVTKFAQLSNRPTGGEMQTGLGLTLCKYLIDLQGGDIGVYNNPTGQGATFWFRLPLETDT